MKEESTASTGNAQQLGNGLASISLPNVGKGDSSSMGPKEPMARDLYILVRNQLIRQTRSIYYKLFPKHEEMKKSEMMLDRKQFKTWLNMYPFIRTIIRESMMPRLWTLKRVEAVIVPTLRESIMKAVQAEPSNFNGYQADSPVLMQSLPSEVYAKEVASKITQ